MQSLPPTLTPTTLDVLAWGSEQLRQQWDYTDDPYRARWECLHAPTNATAVSFDYRGNLLAVGTAAGEVSPNDPMLLLYSGSALFFSSWTPIAWMQCCCCCCCCCIPYSELH